MVSTEPRMELLPEEWQALADVEAAAREVVDEAFLGLGRLRGALAELDKVRGKVSGGG